jgi:hypothetical protein
MTTDKIIECPITKQPGSICYVSEIAEGITMYNSLSTGFWTNSLLKEGEKFYEEQMEILPELYKEIAYVDENNLTWLPQNINIEGKGMIFAYGNSKDNWHWAVVKQVPVLEEEKEKFKLPGGKNYSKYKTDMNSMKLFEPLDFLEALDELGVFEK